MPMVLLLPECGVLPAVGHGGQSGANPGKANVWQYDLNTPPSPPEQCGAFPVQNDIIRTAVIPRSRGKTGAAGQYEK